MKQCQFCGEELPAGVDGKRAFCHQAHRQAYYRQKEAARHEQIASQAGEVEQLKATIQELEGSIEQLERVIRSLKRQLDLEYRYRLDTQARAFVAFVRRQPMTPFIERLLNDRRLPERWSRSNYEAYIRGKDEYAESDLYEFKTLWELLLLESGPGYV